VEEPASDLIAVVDDDESVREATVSLLRSNGFPAATFATAEEFLNSTIVANTRCLLLDIGMPGMGGLELQRRLNSRDPRIPIVFITAHVDAGIRNEAMRSGAVDFLSKPFSEEAFLKAIGKAYKSS
jgi:FixJ family two-component response regulator